MNEEEIEEAICCEFLIVGKVRRRDKFGKLCCLVKSTGSDAFESISKSHSADFCTNLNRFNDCPYLKTLNKKRRRQQSIMAASIYDSKIRPWKG